MSAEQIKVGGTVWPVTDSTFALFGAQTVIGTWQAPGDNVGVWLWLVGHDDPDGYSPRSFHSSNWTLEKPSDAELAKRADRRALREAEWQAQQAVLLAETQEELKRVIADPAWQRIRVLPQYDYEELPIRPGGLW